MRRTNRLLRALLFAVGCALAHGALPALHTSPQASVLVCGGSMMKGDHFSDSVLAVMREHFSGRKRVALVLHASHPEERDRMEARLQKAFAHIGVPATESLHRLNDAGALSLLGEADAIFAGGGETFVLLAELQRTGQLELIRERVLAGVPFGGSSAGANIAGLLIGTTNDFPTAEIRSRAALAFLPATINPHHPMPTAKTDYETRVGKIKRYLRFNPTETVLALANTSVVKLHGGRAALVVGTGWIYRADTVRELVVGEPVPELTR